MKTKVVTLNSGRGDTRKITSAARILDQGGLVAFPTETVYGIGCAAKPEAIAKLNGIKGRTDNKRYTLHIALPKDIAKFVPKISLRAKKLIQKAWPGPLTIVFELTSAQLQGQKSVFGSDTFNLLYKDGTIGLRCPDNKIAAKLLKFTENPIVAPSANLSGMAPAVTAEQVLEQFEGKINLILDTGKSPCKYKKPSTVVKIVATELIILREGVYSRDDIVQMSSISMLFVCTGNTCRSPMAEAFCRKYLSEKLNCDVDRIEHLGYKIGSAGIMGMVQTPASKEVIDICRKKGIDISRHRSRALTPEQVAGSDYIFGMTESHRKRVVEICPDASEKCFLLDSKGDIADPIGAGADVYRGCADQIEKALEKRMSEILI